VFKRKWGVACLFKEKGSWPDCLKENWAWPPFFLRKGAWPNCLKERGHGLIV
jgi:hypothetical protein